MACRGHQLVGTEPEGGGGVALGHGHLGEARGPSGVPALFWKKVLVQSARGDPAGSMGRQEVGGLGLLGGPGTVV